MTLGQIVEIIKKDYPNFNGCDFIIGKYSDDITVDDVFNMIKEIYKDYLNKRDIFAKKCKDFGMYYDNNREKFRFEEGAWYDKENRDKNKEIEKIYGINGIDSFKNNTDFLSFETYKDYERYWINKIENKNDEDMDIFAPFTIVDFSSQEKYFPIHNGFVYEDKLMAESSSEIKKELILHRINCYKELSDIDSDEIDSEKVLNCEDCPNDKKLCRTLTNICDNANKEDIETIISMFGKIGVFFKYGYLTPRIADEMNKKSVYTGKIDIKSLTTHLSWYYAGILY